MIPPAPLQLALVDVGPPRCRLCSRPITRRYCKTCTKSGNGEPPLIGGPSWRAWRRALISTLSSRMRHAGLDDELVQRAVRAVFHDRGEVPVEAADLAAPYLARPCSPARYQDAVDQAVLQHRLLAHLHGLGYTAPHEADEMATAAAAAIFSQRRRLRANPETPKTHEAELLAEAVLEHTARRELADEGLRGRALDAAVRARVEIDMRDFRGRYDTPPQRVEPPRVRIETWLVLATDDDLAAAENEAETPGLARRRTTR